MNILKINKIFSKKIYSCMLACIFILNSFLITNIYAGINGGPDDITMHISVDYENNEIGDKLGRGYSFSVQNDPQRDGNKVGEFVVDRFTDTGTSLNSFNLYPGTGLQKQNLVVEQSFMRAADEAYMTVGVFLFAAARRQVVSLFNIDSTDIYTASEEELYAADSLLKYHKNRWYKVRTIIDSNSGTYNIYIIDLSSGTVVKEELNRKLPPLQGKESYSAGFMNGYARIYAPSVPKGTTGKIYLDDFKVYSVSSSYIAMKIHSDEILNYPKKGGIKSQILIEGLRNSFVLYDDSTVSYVNGEFKTINIGDANWRCIKENNKVYLPLEFVINNLNEGYYLKNNRIYKDNIDISKDLLMIEKDNILFVEAKGLAKIIGKYYYEDSRGIHIISDKDSIENFIDKSMMDELYDARYGVYKPEIPEDAVYTPPENVDANTKAFKQRNSNESIKKLADDFFAMIDLDRKEFSEIKKMYVNSDYEEALKKYKEFFLAHYKKLYEKSPIYKGLDKMGLPSSTSAENLMFNYAGILKVQDEEQSKGVETIEEDKAIKYGEPGKINWDFALPVKKMQFSYYFSEHKSWSPYQFTSLIDAYEKTGNHALIEKWNEYIDDWAMLENKFLDLPASDHTDNDRSFDVSVFINKIGMMNDQGNGLSEFTLARLLGKAVKTYMPTAIMYFKSNPQNWTTGGGPLIAINGLLFDELGFKIGNEFFVNGLRRTEDFIATHAMPDGTESEQNWHYNGEYIKHGAGILRSILKELKPELLTVEKNDEYKDALIEKIKFLSFTPYPDSRLPSGFRVDFRMFTDNMPAMFKEKVPEAFEDKDIKLLNTQLPYPKAISEAMPLYASINKPETPSFTSLSFPYIGFNVFRSGWDNYKDQFGYLYSTPEPSNTTFRRSGSNIFVLKAFGQELITAGEAGMYDNLRSPLLVDGKSQNIDAEIFAWGHRHAMVSAWDEPGNRRWHTSKHFDVAEGIYDRYYGETSTVVKIGQYGDSIYDGSIDAQVDRLKDMITDVEHQRQINFLKDFGLWIVADRMINDDTHEYSQRWYLPAENVATRNAIITNYKVNSLGDYVLEYSNSNVFKSNLISTSVKEKIGEIKTNQFGMPNVSIYNFATSPLKYTKNTVTFPNDNSYKISDYEEIQTNFGGEGEQLLLSVIYPRKSEGIDVLEINEIKTKNEKVTGFEALIIGNKKVKYIASSDKKQLLELDNIKMIGESLTLTVDSKGIIRGVVLGGSEVSINGVTQNIEASDFEFKLEDDRFTDIVPIYTPMPEVKILPEANVFTDKVVVTMSTDVTNTEIRYTTDLSEPTLNSPLYKEPITLTETTTLKVRAFRNGIKKIPNTADGVYASPVRRAVFTKHKLRMDDKPSNVEKGLNYKYYEGPWKEMVSNIYNMVPIKMGNAEKVFDIAAKQTDGSHGFIYDGYIEAKEDGVYTFYAPKEWLMPDILASYDLQVFIGDEMWYPTTRRQGFGTWSIPLSKGMHKFKVKYVDYRQNTPQEFNREGIKKVIWDGIIPDLKISGPNMEKQEIPSEMLYREVKQ